MTEEQKTTYSVSEVAKIVTHALARVEKGGADETKQKVYHELQELAQLINGICHKLTSDKETLHSGKGDITKATVELDEVVKATEAATGQIMDSCEKIQNFAKDIDDPKAQSITDETLNIFEACSFQDITGQRVNKAVKALFDIETRIDKLLEILGQDGRFNISHDETEDTREGDERLKNGPQAAEQAMTQEDIDRLLAE